MISPTIEEQDEALEAVRGWLNGPSGPGFRVLRILLWMAERERYPLKVVVNEDNRPTKIPRSVIQEVLTYD